MYDPREQEDYQCHYFDNAEPCCCCKCHKTLRSLTSSKTQKTMPDNIESICVSEAALMATLKTNTPIKQTLPSHLIAYVCDKSY